MQLTEATTLDRKSGGAEGSAVRRTFRGNVFSTERSELEGLGTERKPHRPGDTLDILAALGVLLLGVQMLQHQRRICSKLR